MKTECQFFNLTKGLDLPIPKVFLANDGSNGKGEGILMEDLSEKAAGIAFFDHVSKEACLNYAEILGKFQANVSHFKKGTFDDSFIKNLCELYKDFYEKYSVKLVEMDPRKILYLYYTFLLDYYIEFINIYF